MNNLIETALKAFKALAKGHKKGSFDDVDG
jgi:hypothetical protein